MCASDPGSVSSAEDTAVSSAIEAMLLMSSEPLSTTRLAEALDIPVRQIEQVCHQIASFYTDTHRGFELRHVGGGWRLWTRPEHSELLAAWVLEGQHAKLSQAALETLAVIAYMQPISRSRISAVRGVNVDGVVRTLLTRGLIEETEVDNQGTAVLLATSDHFLERMGMESLDELPPLAPHLIDASVLEEELMLISTTAQRERGNPDEHLLTSPDTTSPDTTSPDKASALAPRPETEFQEQDCNDSETTY